MGIGLGKKKPSELRRYRRVPLGLPARAIINSVSECNGTLLNISPGDLAMQAPFEPVVGDAATIYVKELDVIEGTVARVFPDGFAISFRLSRARRSLLTEKLMKIVNANVAQDLADRRDAPRHQVRSQRMVCRLPDGSSMFVRVLDTSVDGVAVEAPKKPPVGGDIYVGRFRGVVARHTPRGFVVVYDHFAGDASACDRIVATHDASALKRSVG